MAEGSVGVGVAEGSVGAGVTKGSVGAGVTKGSVGAGVTEGSAVVGGAGGAGGALNRLRPPGVAKRVRLAPGAGGAVPPAWAAGLP